MRGIWLAWRPQAHKCGLQKRGGSDGACHFQPSPLARKPHDQKVLSPQRNRSRRDSNNTKVAALPLRQQTFPLFTSGSVSFPSRTSVLIYPAGRAAFPTVGMNCEATRVLLSSTQSHTASHLIAEILCVRKDKTCWINSIVLESYLEKNPFKIIWVLGAGSLSLVHMAWNSLFGQGLPQTHSNSLASASKCKIKGIDDYACLF